MKSSKPFYLSLILLLLFISSAKSQWIPCQGIEGSRCESIVVQDSFLFIDASGGIFRRQIDSPLWDSACLTGGFMKIRSTGDALFTFGGMTPLWRSVDNGFTWEYIYQLDYAYQNIESVDSVIFLDAGDVILRSVDDGETWTELDTPLNTATFYGISAQDGILYCRLLNIDTLYLSTNYGDNWIGYPLTGMIGQGGMPYYYNQDLWMSAGNNFFIYNELNKEWILQNDSLPSQVYHSQFIEDFETLCCYTNDGFYRFNFQDSLWEDESQGLENRFCHDACRFNNTTYIATSIGPFSRTGNDIWIPQNDDLFGLIVSKVFNIGDRIYALANKKIYYSDDIVNGFDVVETNEYSNANEMIVTDTAWYVGSNSGFSISIDSGQSWTFYNSGLEGRKVFQIAIGESFYYAVVSQPSSHGLFRSRTDSIHWEVLPNEFGNTNFYDIDIINGILFVIRASNSGLYKSVDNGTTFESIPEVGNYVYSSLYVHNDKIFILRDYYEILYSDDLGDTWQPWLYGINEAFQSIDITNSEETTVLGGYISSGNPISCIELFSPNYPEGLNIKDNLPDYLYNSIDNVLLNAGKIFACPSSGGLWYRDDLMVGIKDDVFAKPAASSRLTIYPNPAKDLIHVHFQNKLDDAEYQVIDYSGKMMMKGTVENASNDFLINIPGLASGIYLVVIQEENNVLLGKFLKIE